VNEIPRPNVVLVLSLLSHAAIATLAKLTLFLAFLGYFQAFDSPDPVDAFEVHSPTFLSKFRRDHSITISQILANQLVNPFEQSLRAPWLSKDFACPTQRQLHVFLDVMDSLPALRRAQ